jgi:Na+-transporting methylmalonyl-CoA/oxaloacetate decarboxylase gamma subunit
MTPNFLLFCAQGAEPAGLGINWTSLGMVLAGVTVLMFIIRGIGLAAAASQPDAPGSKSPASKADSTAVSSTDSVAPEIIAILTAAASVALGTDKVRVIGVREVYHGNVLDQRAWAREGRREIYLSHRIR